jgi:hypothetical protein
VALELEIMSVNVNVSEYKLQQHKDICKTFGVHQLAQKPEMKQITPEILAVEVCIGLHVDFFQTILAFLFN